MPRPEIDTYIRDTLQILRCPQSHDELHIEDNELVAALGEHRYRIDENNIPLFAEQLISPEALTQQRHYDRVAAAYLEFW